MQISLSPVSSTWGKKEIKEFYKKVANLAIDNVYLGELVCLKRKVLAPKDYQEIADFLKSNGKKVYITTPALVTSTEEFDQIKEYIFTGDGIEANMIGALSLISEDEKMKEKDLIAGPFLNLYNWRSAEVLVKLGASKLIPPFEISGQNLSDIAKNTKINIEVEAWGNITTAISWRCYSARAVDKNRADCGLECLKFKEGETLKTTDDEEIFIINGTQIQSAKTYCLVEALIRLKEIGVSSIRLQPHHTNTKEIIDIFKQCIDEKLDLRQAAKELSSYAPNGLCNGWFYGQSGWKYIKNREP